MLKPILGPTEGAKYSGMRHSNNYTLLQIAILQWINSDNKHIHFMFNI